ncbi:TlpA disulfide reductase family protein [Luteimonas sp. MC1825]|uniref:TlpA family protein disulfide reductase n=1 Tax=Luteimonas sp. MC1825 TaxID=2761107 RepID=UPI001622AF98|nr:TlpA disulfide reductase family protein [Luteimonas sp. MC1825]MBB6598383.1 TlpA family protein disulfide reductase [Luteimonas sp. MC1825]QOC88583.1 TlpA family protein disulfide reductase [Luteimonas sp. MC1825]
MRTRTVVLAALAAGVLGIVAGLAVNGPGPLLRTEFGQRALQGAMTAVAPPAPDGLQVAVRGEPVPALTLPGLDGSPILIPDHAAGRPLLVNLWASWCGPCIEEMPELERFAVEQGANGVQVIGIALDDQNAVEDFLTRIPVSYPIAIDIPGPRDAGVQLGNPRGVLPYTVLIGSDGRLLKQRIGPFTHGEISGWAKP